MWKYHENYNYYDCFLGEHRVSVQPLYTSYCMRLYLGTKQLVEMKIDFKANNIEEALNIAMKIVFDYASRKVNLWNEIATNASEILK